MQIDYLKEALGRLTWVDYLALVAVLRGCYVGYRSGFFPELLRIASYLVTSIVVYRYKDGAAEYLTLNTFLNHATATVVSLTVLAAAAFAACKAVTVLILKLLKLGEGGFVNRLIGMVFGACRWVVLLSLLFLVVEASPLEPLKKDIRERSLTGRKVASVAPLLFDFLSKLSPQLGVRTDA